MIDEVSAAAFAADVTAKDDCLAQRLRRMALVKRDAHSLYARHGFKPLASPTRWMERHDPEVYAANAVKERP